jgi:cardiolipin synthase A/B
MRAMWAMWNLSHLWVALVAGLVTLVVALIAFNLMGGERRIEKKLPRLYDADDVEFQRALGSLLGPRLVGGNQVDVLVNGREIFPAMLEAIAAARETIGFETFIYWSGDIGERFVCSLCERAQAGVRVHVLLDWVGSLRMDQQLVNRMQTAGVEVIRFHKPHWSNWGKMNNRTHRKLLVIDGQLGFTGGVGIADHWEGDARNPQEWRDTHFRVRGPVVAQMQSVFLDNWMRATGEVLHGAAYFPELPDAGDQQAQMFSSSPSGGSESMHLMVLLALTAARTRIAVSASYFVPDPLTLHTLVAAARRGVHIRILLPGRHIDAVLVRKASRASWGALLAAGVEIAEYQPTMFHMKSLLVDDRFVSVGSANLDDRSFLLNDEANLNVISPQLARQLGALFEKDWAQGKPVSLGDWRRRPASEKLVEWGASLLRRQL